MTVRQTLGFLLLCLLSSATWLTAGLLPSSMSPVAGEGVRLLGIGALGLVLSLSVDRRGTPLTWRRCASVGAASLGLIGIPFLLLAGAEGRIASTNVVLMFACVPIVLAVAGASSSNERGLRHLPAGLMGLAGLLVLLPLGAPQGGAAMLGSGMVVLAVLCTAGGMVWMHRLLAGFPIAATLGIAGLLNGVALGLVGVGSKGFSWSFQGVGIECLRCLLFDLPQIALLLWLLRSVTPLRVSARYVGAPLLTVVEGLMVMRPRFEFRTFLGVVMLSAGAYLLVRAERVKADTSLRLG